MKNNLDKSKDINAWAEREHEIKLHEQVQNWGEAILPLLYDEANTSDLPARLSFFEYLMTSVERGERDVAGLIRRHEAEMLESTRSWYTDKLDFLNDSQREQMIQRQFEAWFKIHQAGK